MHTTHQGQQASSLRTFALGQLMAAASGVVFLTVLSLLNPTPAIYWLVAIALANAASSVAVLLLLRRGWVAAASYLFVCAGIAAIAAAAPVVGSTSAAPAVYVWPVLTAALISGRTSGIAAGSIATLAFGTTFYLEVSGAMHPLLAGSIGTYIGGFSLALALGLGVVVADVYRRNNQQALSEAESRAQAEAATAEQLTATFTLEGEIKAEAGRLAAQLAGMSTAQDAAASQAATGIGQVTSQTAELSATAAQIEAAAKNIRTAGENTAALVNEVINRTEADRTRFSQVLASGQQTQTFATELGRSVKQMSQILGLIESVVAEIQMLSLNATIEATGAGETGRRFGVIAAEVGKLGERVGEAAHDIAAIIGRVQVGAAALVPAASRTVADINATIAAASITAQQLAEVSSSADEAAREGFSISGATVQQRKVTTDIAAAMIEVSRLADDLAHSSTDLAAVAGTLTESVGRLAAVAAPTPTFELSQAEGGVDGDDTNQPLPALRARIATTATVSTAK